LRFIIFSLALTLDQQDILQIELIRIICGI
jgi:hypothetical protein